MGRSSRLALHADGGAVMRHLTLDTTLALIFKKGSVALFSLAMMAGLPAQAADPHVHGQAHLSVAVDGSQVQIQLESPLDGLLGFEHAPRNARQREAVRAMAQRLHQADKLLVLTAAAGCQLKQVDLRSAALPAELLQAKTAASPGTAASATNAATDAHADMEANFSFTCSQPAALKSLALKPLFAAFPGLRQIDAQLATGSKQSAAKLTAKNPRLAW